MKSWWLTLETRIDGLALRERGMVFMAGALLVLTLFSTAVIDPMSAREKQLSQQIRQDQQQIAALQSEIQARVSAHRADPDTAERIRLQQLQRESTEIREQMKGMQNGLVAPEKMPALLEDLLKRDGKLQLRSLKTLPVAVLNETPVSAAPGAAQPRKDAHPVPPQHAVYKHAVQIVVQGGYHDLLRYLASIEDMPWQIFWERASLDVHAHPSATLTLTLFTLSLDRKWLHI